MHFCSAQSEPGNSSKVPDKSNTNKPPDKNGPDGFITKMWDYQNQKDYPKHNKISEYAKSKHPLD